MLTQAETLSNTTSDVKAVTYLFTPHIDPTDGGSECQNGLDTTITIYVNPRPDIEVTADDTLCYNGSTTFTVTNPNTLRGTWRYDVDVTYPAGVTGSLGDLTNQTVLTQAETLSNTTSDVKAVTYLFTPHIDPSDGGAECQNGLDTTITIYVNPRPDIEVTADDTLCYNGSTTFTVTNPNTLRGTWRYDVDVTYPAGVTGSLGDLTNQTVLTQAETLSNTTSDVKAVTYLFTPHIDPSDGGAECQNGLDTTITIYVNPRPDIEVTADDTLCYNGSTTFTVTNPNTLRGTWRYDVDVTYPAGVTGSLGDLTNQTVLTQAETLSNTTSDVKAVTYLFTPHIDPSDGGAECQNGLDTTITIYVNPRPDIEVTADDTLCYNGSTTFTVTNPNTLRGTWRYDVDVTYPAGVTGSLGDLTNQTVLTQAETLSNTTSDVKAVTYLFTPHIDPSDGGAECQNGLDTTITIYVNPRPDIEVTADDTLCYNGSTTFTVTNPNTLRGTWRYDVDVTYPAGVTGSLGDLTNQTVLTQAETLSNTTSDVKAVTYLFTPHIDPSDGGAECQNGLDTTITIYVNPQPDIEVTADDTLCYNGSTTFTVTNPNTLRCTWRYDVDVTYPAGVTGSLGNLTNQTVLTQAETLSNTTSDVKAVTYLFTPHIDPSDGGAECQNGLDTTINVYVNPRPDIEVTADDTLCYNGSTTFTVTNPNTVRGTWRYDVDVTYPAGVTGSLGNLTNQTVLTQAETLSNTTSDVKAVTYLFTPHIDPTDGGAECQNGLDTTITVYVNPQPDIEVTADDTLCYNGSTTFTITNPNTVRGPGDTMWM